MQQEKMDNRQIDILVAQYVMGGIFPDNPDEFDDKEKIWFYIKRGKLLRGRPYQLSPDVTEGKVLFDHLWKEWKPTEDIATAWQVVEKINSQISEKGHGIYKKFLWHMGFDPQLVELSSQDAALKICLAALKANGINDSKLDF